MWGEHMHHGYYPEGNTRVSNQDAQIDMIERTLSWAGVESVSKASRAPLSPVHQAVCRVLKLTSLFIRYDAWHADGRRRVRHWRQQQTHSEKVRLHSTRPHTQPSTGARCLSDPVC